MTMYEYTPLNTATGEIRVLELHSGAFEDEIQISILTKPFVIPEPVPFKRDHLEDIRSSLPSGWAVSETLEGRTIFWDNSMGPKYLTSSWTHPSQKHGPIPREFEEDTVSVAEPAFEALSYTWGPIECKINLEVVPLTQGSCLIPMEEKVYLPVSQNLYDALKHLRNATTPRTLWVDAICIDQNNTTERNHQVSRMADIYRFASRVVVWLGPASHDSSRALRILGQIGDRFQCTKGLSYIPFPDCTNWDSDEVLDTSRIDPESETWHAVHSLLSRPWFSRLWV
jgi:hypothetical protein